MLRITVTLEERTVEEIDRRVRNRSRFIQEAVGRELERRRLEEYRRSLAAPHPESEAVAEAGFEDWIEAGAGDEELLDLDGGTAVRWEPGRGFFEVDQRKGPPR